MLIHAEQQADMEEAAQERRHGREIDLDDEHWDGWMDDMGMDPNDWGSK